MKTSTRMKTSFFALLLATVMCAAPSDHDDTVIVPSLKGLVFVSQSKDIRKAGATSSGISLAGVPMLDSADFQSDVSAYLGKPLTFRDLAGITSLVSAFYKKENHPLVNVVAPEQNVTTGVVQIVVSEFRVGEVRVQGNRWFSDQIVSAPIDLQHGDTIDTKKLLNELNSANTNPFRRVDLVYQPAPQAGYTDLVLNTKDRFPVTAYSGFDNSGTSVTAAAAGTWAPPGATPYGTISNSPTNSAPAITSSAVMDL